MTLSQAPYSPGRIPSLLDSRVGLPPFSLGKHLEQTTPVGFSRFSLEQIRGWNGLPLNPLEWVWGNEVISQKVNPGILQGLLPGLTSSVRVGVPDQQLSNLHFRAATFLQSTAILQRTDRIEQDGGKMHCYLQESQFH